MMCNFVWSKEITKVEVENAMLIPGEYKIIDDKYYIPNVPGFLDGYLCPCDIINVPMGDFVILEKGEDVFSREKVMLGGIYPKKGIVVK